MRTHPDISLMRARNQACTKIAATCLFLAVCSNGLITTQRIWPVDKVNEPFSDEEGSLQEKTRFLLEIIIRHLAGVFCCLFLI